MSPLRGGVMVGLASRLGMDACSCAYGPAEPRAAATRVTCGVRPRRDGAADCGRRASPRSAPSGLPAALPPSVARLLLFGECGAHLRLLVCAGKSRDFKSNIRRCCVHCWVSQGQ